MFVNRSSSSTSQKLMALGAPHEEACDLTGFDNPQLRSGGRQHEEEEVVKTAPERTPAP